MGLKQVEVETRKHVGLCKTHGKFEVLQTKIMDKWRNVKCPDCVEDDINQPNKTSVFLKPLPKRFNHCSFDNFIVDDLCQESFNHSKNFALKFKSISKRGGSIIMFGKCGTGKTHLACAIANHIVANNTGDCLYTKVYELTGDVKSSWSNASTTESAVIKKYTNPDLLIIDEVGVQFGSEAEQLILFRILNQRYEDVKPTIIVSNLDDKGLNQYLGERLVDRVYEGGGGMVAFNWESYRRTRSQP